MTYVNWSARLFFFIALAFLVYVIVVGDGSSWKSLLTTKVTS